MIKRNDRRCSFLCAAITIWFSSFIILSPNLAIYAQDQDSQAVPSDEGEFVLPESSNEGEFVFPALIRCSNGSIVEIAAECPSTDQCPSSTPSANEILQCTPSLFLQQTSIRQVGDSIQSINITSDKKSYKPGDAVNITIKNTGAVPLTFPNSILGLTIQNAATDEKYPLFSAQVITILDSGQEKSLKWDQRDSFGQLVKDGNYTASTSSGLINANTTFSVVR
jgi:hypothetical protein